MKTSEKIATTIADVDAIIKKLKEIKDDPQLKDVLYNTGAGYTIVDAAENLKKFQNEIENVLAKTMIKELKSGGVTENVLR